MTLNEKKRRCRKCHTKKSFDDFHKNPKQKDGLDSRCKKCIKARDRVTHQKRLSEKKKWVLDYKTSTPCKDCKIQYHPWVMEFDHIADDKTCNISDMVHKQGTLKRLKKEVDKCELVCANCHRMRTYSRFYIKKS